MDFYQKLNAATNKNNSLLCVGLDPVIEKLPKKLQKDKHPLFAFNKYIIDQTYDMVCAYKPNSAFYEALGSDGIYQLQQTIKYIHNQYNSLPVILDAKRGDIGSTNEGYTRFAFDYLNVDALTVMPYMGIESLEIFFNQTGRGIIVGCHSSNPEAAEFQELLIEKKPLYILVAEKVFVKHTKNKNIMIFMGATYAEQLRIVRELVGDMTMLVPGVGAQEGALEDAVRNGLTREKKGMIINASRSIIFAENPNKEAKRLKKNINKMR